MSIVHHIHRAPLPWGMPEPSRLTIPLPALSMAALSWGPANGPLALLLHGFPDTAWTWRHLGPALAEQGWWAVAPFSRGYAPTGPAADGDYRVGALVDDVLGLREALGGDQRAVLVGHDWGALTAHAVGAHRPEAFERIVTMAVPPIPALLDGVRSLEAFRRTWPTLARQVAMSWYTAFNQLPVVAERALPRLVRFLWRRWSPGYDPTADLAHFERAMPDRLHRTAALSYYRHAILPTHRDRRYDAAHADWLRSPRVPTLYLHGATDGCVNPDFVRRADAHLPPGSGAQLVLDAGHFLHLERPDFVNARIARFLAS